MHSEGREARHVSPAALEELGRKYEEMLRMRLEDGPSNDPREAMASLARRFPGALREIDELPLEVIRARVDSLRRASQDESQVEAWMEALALFHALTRGALSVKRWLAGKRDVHDETVAAFSREADTLAYADDARAWAQDLARLARPPRGRVTELVFERIASTLGVSTAEARHLVFGAPRRERRARDDR